MKLVLLATTLLFYTQTTETKKCIRYAITPSNHKFTDAKAACMDMKGELASEDLLDSENADKAVFEVYKYLVENNGLGDIWLNAESKDPSTSPKESNPFVFTNGTEIKDTNMLIKWRQGQPQYSSNAKCIYFAREGLMAIQCTFSFVGLCKIESECEEKCPIVEQQVNNASDRSRANLPVLALFMAGSVFKAFYALVRPVM